MDFNGREENIVEENGSIADPSSSLQLSHGDQQTPPPSISVFYGLSLPANSILVTYTTDPTACRAIGLVSQVPLYHNDDIGHFVYVQTSGMPTASPSAADPEHYETTMQLSFISKGINNLAHISSLKLADDDMLTNTDSEDDVDEQGSEASYVSSTSSTVKPKRAPNGCGKDPPLSDSFKLQAMRGDGMNLSVKELRSVLSAMGKVILGWKLADPSKVNWKCVKSAAEEYGFFSAEIYDPNNPRKGGPKKSKANGAELRDLFHTLKTVLVAVCDRYPNRMEEYERVAALAKAPSVEVRDSDPVGGSLSDMLPVTVQQHNEGWSSNTIAATSSARVKKTSQRPAASPPTVRYCPYSRDKGVYQLKRPLPRIQPQSASASFIISESLESNNYPQPSVIMQVEQALSQVTMNEDNGSAAPTGTSQPVYIQLNAQGTNGLDTRSSDGVASTSDMLAAAADNVKMMKELTAMSALQCIDPTPFKSERESHVDHQYSTAQFGECVTPADRTRVASAETPGKFEGIEPSSFNSTDDNHRVHYSPSPQGNVEPAALPRQLGKEFGKPSGEKGMNADDCANDLPAAYAVMQGKIEGDQYPSFSDNYDTTQIDAEIAAAFEGQLSDEFSQLLARGGVSENEDDFREFVDSLDENKIYEICQQLFGGGTLATDDGMEIMEARGTCPPPPQVMLANPQALLDDQLGAQMTDMMQIDTKIAPAFEGQQPSEEFNQPPPPGGEKVNEDDRMEFANEISGICRQFCGGGTQQTDDRVEITDVHDRRPSPSQMMLANPQALLDIQPGAQMIEETPPERNGLSGSYTPSVVDDMFINFGD
jgi:hypothetical protein